MHRVNVTPTIPPQEIEERINWPSRTLRHVRRARPAAAGVTIMSGDSVCERLQVDVES